MNVERHTTLSSILITILFLTTSASFWFYKNVSNEENFKTHVHNAIETPESRQAIAAIIIEEGFKNRPILKNILSEQAESALAGALDGPRVQTILDRFILQVHDSLFSTEPKAIVIDLSNIKNFVKNLSFLAEAITDTQRQEIHIPDSIVLVKAGEIPSIARVGLTLLWIGPIALVSALALLVWLIWRSVNRISLFKILGASLALGSLIVILFTEWYKPIILALVQNSYSRIIAEEILNEFLKSLTNQNLILFFIGIILIGGGFLYQQVVKKNRKFS